MSRTPPVAEGPLYAVSIVSASFRLNSKSHTAMKKKAPSTPRIPGGKLELEALPQRRRNIPVDDLFLHARSFHKAAQALAGSLRGGDPFSDVGLAPVVFMYRHALELHLKAIVLAEGGNFLASKPDPLSVHKTHSVAWLGQFVVQIVTALKWEPEFRCLGIEKLEDFKAFVAEVNSVDPGQYLFRFPGEPEAGGAFDLRGFARRMDALLELLDSTADALAAEWGGRNDAADAINGVGFMDGPVQ
jgi:hypothetical protein